MEDIPGAATKATTQDLPDKMKEIRCPKNIHQVNVQGFKLFLVFECYLNFLLDYLPEAETALSKSL